MDGKSSFFVYLRSDDSSYLFPENTPFSFTVALPNTLKFQGAWECALAEITYPDIEQTLSPDTLTLLCDFVENSIIDGTTKTILRRFNDRQFKGQVFGDCRYIDVVKSTAHQLAFRITTNNTNIHPQQQSGVTSIVLSFRKKT